MNKENRMSKSRFMKEIKNPENYIRFPVLLSIKVNIVSVESSKV